VASAGSRSAGLTLRPGATIEILSPRFKISGFNMIAGVKQKAPFPGPSNILQFFLLLGLIFWSCCSGIGGRCNTKFFQHEVRYIIGFIAIQNYIDATYYGVQNE
jgi:hypothetical protein